MIPEYIISKTFFLEVYSWQPPLSIFDNYLLCSNMCLLNDKCLFILSRLSWYYFLSAFKSIRVLLLCIT